MKTHRVVAAALLMLAGACRSMQSVPIDFIPDTKPAVVYLSDQYGMTQAVANPRISGDTVLGTIFGGSTPVAVPLNRVERMSTVRVDRARTALLIGGIAVMGGLMTYAIITNALGSDSGFCDYDRQPIDGMSECGYASNP